MTLMTEQNTKDKDARMTDRNYTNTNSRQNTNRQTGQDKARPRQTSIQQIYKTPRTGPVFHLEKMDPKTLILRVKMFVLKNKQAIHRSLQPSA